MDNNVKATIINYGSMFLSNKEDHHAIVAKGVILINPFLLISLVMMCCKSRR